MNRFNLKRISFLLVVCLVVMFACAPENNGWLGKGYHNISSHYNGYFYSLGEITKIEQTIVKSQTDDYNRILKLFPSVDSTTAKGYDKEAQEAIKMASLAIQRHPHSKWTDDAYILVGKARLYTLDWGNAIQTLKYVNTKSKDKDARHRAIIILIRTFVEHKEFNNAQAAIDYLLKEKLNKTNLKDFYLEKAFYHQTQNDYDNMVRSLTKIDELLKKKDRRGRIYFIIGQVYQKLGFESEAYSYYKKCLSTNPEYEVDFYARLYLAQVTEISRARNVSIAHKSFKKLLKDSKNKEFKDKIYYEMGVFELKQKNLSEAMTDLRLAIRTGSNKRVDGEAYLLMGEIYYDTLKNFEQSQAYYDSAISALPKDFENYDAIKLRAGVLNEFVKNLKTIQWQDSLLSLASLDSAALRAKVDVVVTAKRLADEKRTGKKKRGGKFIDIQKDENNNIFPSGDEEPTEEATVAGDWYFANPSVVAQGQQEFTRVWGNIVLEDNWRRSKRSISGQLRNAAVVDSAAIIAAKTPAVKVDPVTAEYERINKEIPRTDDQKKEALSKIEDAYFALGDIYYFKLLEKPNAVSSYNKLLKRFPESEYTPEVLYKLYLIYKETDPALAESYAKQVKEKYPNSPFAKILINPDYLKLSSQAVEKQKVLYKKAYEQYDFGNYRGALQTIEEAKSLGETIFIPNLELLKIIVAGKLEDINRYQLMLDEFIQKYPEAEVTPYAKKLVEASHDFQKNQEKQKTITYLKSFEEHHYFIIVYRQADKITNQVSSTLERFNTENFPDLRLKTSTLILSDDYIIAMVSELPRIRYSIEYYKMFIDKLPDFPVLQTHKISTFVITKDNFDIFYRTKGLDEYIRFFEKNYNPENQ